MRQKTNQKPLRLYKMNLPPVTKLKLRENEENPKQTRELKESHATLSGRK